MIHHLTLHILSLEEPHLFAEEMGSVLKESDFPLPNVRCDDNQLSLIWLYRLHKNIQAWNMSHHVMKHFFSDIMIDFSALLNKYHAGIYYSTSQQLYEVLRFGCVQNICGVQVEALSEQNLRLSDKSAYLSGVRRYMEKALIFCKRLKENPEMAGWYDTGMLYKKYHELEAFCLALGELDNQDVSDAKTLLMECCTRIYKGTSECSKEEV